jgi:hypothetical protein
VNEILESVQSRRGMLRSALALAGGMAVGACGPRGVQTAVQFVRPAPPLPVPAAPVAAAPVVASNSRHLVAPAGVRPELFHQAVAALDKHSMHIPSHDRIAIADFSAPSARPRFHIVNLGTGACESLLVAHGSGSDPEHTGLLQRFSNEIDSKATCEGAFVTADYYSGAHGSSQRLMGLDPTNSNALDRAIVVHSAWYSNPDMVAKWGKLGRSEGCFAVGEADLEKVFLSLGEGRMIYAAKV